MMPKEIKNKFTRIEKKNIRTKEIAEEETKKKMKKRFMIETTREI